jgi:DNA invertase Pin-like site-specific DNA recombinase
MTISYIRPDKSFKGVYEQLKHVNAYIEYEGIEVDKEFIDQTSQNRRCEERPEVLGLFRPQRDGIIIVYDVWVLSSYIDDVIQMISCLLKNGMQIHFVKPSVVIDRHSDVMVVLGLIDQLRQILQEGEKKAIGRPKGSRSASKFDQFHDDIIQHLRAHKSVSEMARIFGVSRSSLKDYIESRELREVAFGMHPVSGRDGAADVINTIKCPVDGAPNSPRSIK